jgi:hypothetical protein
MHDTWLSFNFVYSTDHFEQTIVVTTRPLLFCCLKKVFESPKEVGPLVSSRKIRPLLSMSLDASQKILNILESLQDQDLLGIDCATYCGVNRGLRILQRPFSRGI